MMNTLILVASGGAIGATLRYLWGVMVHRLSGGPTEFPVAIMGANILGSFLMGCFVVLAAHKGLTHASPFVMTGVLGGFTTFSAFSLEAMTLIERGALGQAAAYMVLSVVLSVFALMAGLWITRGIVA
jgi:CrcB protein